MLDCVSSRQAVILLTAIVMMWTSGAEVGLSAVSAPPVSFPSALISQLTIPTCVGDLMATSTPSSSPPTMVSISALVLSLPMRTCMRQAGTSVVTILQPASFAKDFQATITSSPCPTVAISRVGGNVSVSGFVGMGAIKVYCTPTAPYQSPPMSTGAYITQSVRQTIDVSVVANTSDVLFPVQATSTCSSSPLQVSVVANESAFVLSAPQPPAANTTIPPTLSNDIIYTISGGSVVDVNYTLKACTIVASVTTDRCLTVVDTRSMAASPFVVSVRGVSYFTIATSIMVTTPFLINVTQTSTFGRSSCQETVKFVSGTADAQRLAVPTITAQSAIITTTSSSLQLVGATTALALSKIGTTSLSTVSAFYNITTAMSVRITTPFLLGGGGGISVITACNSTSPTPTSCTVLALGASTDIVVANGGLTIKIEYTISTPFSAPIFITPLSGSSSSEVGIVASLPAVMMLHVLAPLPAVMSIVTPPTAPLDMLTSVLSMEYVTGTVIASNKLQIGQLLGKLTIVVLSGGCKVGVNSEENVPTETQVAIIDGTTAFKVLPSTAGTPSYCTIGVLSDTLVDDDLQGTLWFVDAPTTSTTTSTTTTEAPVTTSTTKPPALTNTTTTTANTTSTTPVPTSSTSTTTTATNTTAAVPTTTAKTTTDPSASDTTTKPTTTTTTTASTTTAASTTTSTTTAKPSTTTTTTTAAPVTSSTTKATTTSATTTTEAPTTTTTTPESTSTTTTTSSPANADEASSTSPLKWLYNNFPVVVLVVFIIVLVVCFKDTLWKLLQSNFPSVFGQYEGLDNNDGDDVPTQGDMGGQVVDDTIFQADRSGRHQSPNEAAPGRSLSPQVGVRRTVAPVEGSDDTTAVDMTAITSSSATRPVMKRVSQPPAAPSDVVTDEEDSDFDNFFASKTASPHSSPPMPPPVPVVIHKAIIKPSVAASSAAPSTGGGGGSEVTSDVSSRPGSTLRRGGGGGLQLNTATKPQKPTGKKSTALRGANKLPLASKLSSSAATGKDENFLENFFDAPPTTSTTPATHSDPTPPVSVPKKSSVPAATSSGWGDDDDEWIE